MFHIRLIKSKRDEMIKNRYKKQRRKYVPIRTCHSKKKNKKHEFISKGQETTINKEGIKMESSAVLQKTILCGFGLVITMLLFYFGIKDEAILFEGFGVKLSCKLAGAFTFLLSGIGFFWNKPKVKIEN